MLYRHMRSESQRLGNEISELQTELASLPEGKLSCAKDGNRVKWFKIENGEAQYISKKERNLAEKLAYKKYLSIELEEKIHEKRAIDFYLRHHNPKMGEAVRKMYSHPGYQELLSARTFDNAEKEWLVEPWKKNEKYPEQLIYRTASGNIVRSKSEVLIDDYLYRHRVPFRYECELVLGEVTLYPDFTILHPLTHQVCYLEHFGKIDNVKYSRNAFAKMQLYAEHGFYPGERLITTFETGKNPLTPDKIERVMAQYLL